MLLLVLAAPAQTPTDSRGRPAGLSQRLALAESLIASEQAGEATELLAPVVADKSADADSLNLAGKASYQLKDWPSALALFKRAIAKRPNEASLFLNVGLVQFELQAFDDAASSLEQALKLDSRMSAAHTLLGRIAIERNDPASAEPRFRKAIAISPTDLVPRYFLGLFFLKLRRNADAAAMFEQCLKLAPDHPSAHFNLGLALRRLGKTEEADAHLRRFKDLQDALIAAIKKQQLITSRLLAANEALSAHRATQALDLALEARQSGPGIAAVHALLAQIYAALGKTAEAEQARAEYERLQQSSGGR